MTGSCSRARASRSTSYVRCVAQGREFRASRSQIRGSGGKLGTGSARLEDMQRDGVSRGRAVRRWAARHPR